MKSNQSTVVGKYRSRVMELQLDNAFFRSTNPLLRNYERNRDELEKTGWGITKEEMATHFSGGTVEREYREKRNYKEIVLPIRIDIGESKTGDMRVWYNDKTWNDCLEELKEQVIAKGKSNGLSWSLIGKFPFISIAYNSAPRARDISSWFFRVPPHFLLSGFRRAFPFSRKIGPPHTSEADSGTIPPTQIKQSIHPPYAVRRMLVK